jgi:hypothetical protein
MEIHVSLLNATSAERLAERLAGVSDSMAVTFDPGRRNVRVLTEMESNRAVVAVIDTVDAWLAEDGAGAARVWVGERSYTMAGPGQIGGDAWL